MIELACHLRRGGFSLELDTRLDSPATGIFGPSGSGKSSLLHALAGLIPAERVTVRVGGATLVAGPRRPRPHHRRIGLVFQDHRLFPHLSVRANLLYGRRAQTTPDFAEIVDLLDIAPLLERRPRACSGGQRQRIALGRALLAAPRLLLLDEPLSSLDDRLKREILPYLRRIRETCGIPLIMVSHDLDELLSVTDRILFLESGRCRGQGTIAELAQRPELVSLLHDCGLVFALHGHLEQDDTGKPACVCCDGPAGARIHCGPQQLSNGSRVEVLLRPEDVVIARTAGGRSSLRNRCPGLVRAITPGPQPGSALVTVDIGTDAPCLAAVSQASCAKLALAPGVLVEAQWKAMAARVRAC
ncbi:MAG: molybdenum ABC transporter ATP-binding protein [Planctomycetota bacterium]